MRFLALTGLLCLSAAPVHAAGDTVPLAPGETIVGTFLAPSAVVRVPLTMPSQAARGAPPLEIDPVTNKPRNRSGWSGSQRRPASIGCFPAGACAGLNGA